MPFLLLFCFGGFFGQRLAHALFPIQQASYLWEEIPRLQQRLNPAQAACSCTLQTRLKMLQAVAHLQVGLASLSRWSRLADIKAGRPAVSQVALGTQDLGRVYFEPIKDKHGNALLVLLKDSDASLNPDGVRWMRLCKLQLQRKSISCPEEPSAVDALLITLHVGSGKAAVPVLASLLGLELGLTLLVDESSRGKALRHAARRAFCPIGFRLNEEQSVTRFCFAFDIEGIARQSPPCVLLLQSTGTQQSGAFRMGSLAGFGNDKFFGFFVCLSNSFTSWIWPCAFPTNGGRLPPPKRIHAMRQTHLRI